MALSIAKGYTDTAIPDFATCDVSLPAVNWSADFALKSRSAGEALVTNMTCAVDQPETFRFAQRKVANVYAGTDIEASAYLPNRGGTSTLLELREVWSETSSTDDTYKRLIPVRCGVSLTVPSYAGITADMALGLVLRAVAAAFDEGDDTSAGIAGLLRGVLVKQGL